MDCNQIASNVQLFVDEELSPEQANQIQTHLSLCPDCNHRIQMEMLFKHILRERVDWKPAAPELVEDVRYHVMNAAV